MLSLYRAWLGPGPCVSRPAPPPGAHRPVPVRARPPSPAPPSPASSDGSELDVERVEEPADSAPSAGAGVAPGASTRRTASGAVLDVASCDGPVRFSRVPNAAWRAAARPGPPAAAWCRPRGKPPAQPQYYACKTCGSKFPSYYFVHKHRKRCHVGEPEEPAAASGPAPPAAPAAPAPFSGSGHISVPTQ